MREDRARDGSSLPVYRWRWHLLYVRPVLTVDGRIAWRETFYIRWALCDRDFANLLNLCGVLERFFANIVFVCPSHVL